MASPAEMTSVWSFFKSFWTLLGLVFTSAVATLLLVLHICGWRGSSSMIATLDHYHSTVVLAVQAASQILGLSLVLALCCLARIHLRISAAKGPVNLDFARLMNSLSLSRPVSEGRISYVFAAFCFALLSAAPGPIWAPALTPLIVPTQANGTMIGQSYAKLDLSDSDMDGYSSATITTKGFFSFDPQDLTGILIESGRQATNKNGPNGTSSHAKLDNTGYVYHGRHYGAGSAVGLQGSSSTSGLLDYEYSELGIVAQTECQRNETSDFHIVNDGKHEFESGDWAALVGYTSGSFADGTPCSNMFVVGNTDQDLFAVDVAIYPRQRQRLSLVMIAAREIGPGDNIRVLSSRLNHMQCTITYSAHEFITKVNVTNSSIEAIPGHEIEWPMWADTVVRKSTQALNSLSRSDNGFAGSRVAQAMALNTMTFMDVSTSRGFDPDSVPEEVIARSLEAFVNSIVDNMLGLINGGRMMILNDTQEVAAIITENSVRLGEPAFIYTIFVLNWLIVLFCIGYIGYTKAWQKIANLDFTDLVAVVLSSSKGGSDLYDVQGEQSDPRSIDFQLHDPHAKWPAIVPSEDNLTVAHDSYVAGKSSLGQRQQKASTVQELTEYISPSVSLLSDGGRSHDVFSLDLRGSKSTSRHHH